MIELSIFNSNIKILKPETLTSGRVGHKIHFSFDNKWDNLDKKAIFQAGSVNRAVTLDSGLECETEIPKEVLETPNLDLMIGVKGTSQGNLIILPTKYIRLGYIHKGAK